MPHFDDVVDMIDAAEAELESELESQSWDRPIQRFRVWHFGTAHLYVHNPQEVGGLDHRSLIRFLWGLRESGREFGFWSCAFGFHDSKYSTVTARGFGGLHY